MRRPSRRRTALLAALAALVALVGIGGLLVLRERADAARDRRADAAAAAAAVVAVGDSVPAGTRCDCRPYPERAADDLAAVVHHRVPVFNDAVPGAETTDVLTQLRTDAATRGHVRRAGLVLVEVGANDLAHSSACGNRSACYIAQLPQVRTRLAAIVDEIHRLAGRRAVDVVLLDYWSAWLGGRYAHAQGPAYEAAATDVTRALNATVRDVATSSHSGYVDLRHAFRGPDDDHDETALLASDGDHPNEGGVERIAEAVRAVVVAS